MQFLFDKVCIVFYLKLTINYTDSENINLFRL